MSLLRPVPRETFPSFLSRLAASKGVRTVDFAVDLSAPLKRFLLFEPESMEAVARWAELPPETLDELMSWTGVPIGDVRTEFRGEAVTSRAVRSPEIRGCPTCLREDALTDPKEPLSVMALRGHWQLREVTVCLEHRRMLVPLWTEGTPMRRYDTQHQLSRILGEILSGDMDGPEITPSAFDLWLDDRLLGEPDPTWLALHGTAASAAFCRMCGIGLTRVSAASVQVSEHDATAAGFTIVRGGPQAIKRHLVDLSIRVDTDADPIRQALSRLIFALESHLREDRSFDFVRATLRDALLDIWPLAPGEPLLGTVVDRRRVHSVVTASAELGITARRLRPILVEAGALRPEDHRPDKRATFDADMFASALKDISLRIGDRDMRRALGATDAEFAALQAFGIISPCTSLAGARLKWRAADAQALLDELRGFCVSRSSAQEEQGWLLIHMAQMRTGVDVGDIIAGIRSRDIAITEDDPALGYRGFKVRSSEVLAYAKNTDARQLLSKGSSQAELGRRLGIREASRMTALIEAGELRAEKTTHPVTHRDQWRVSGTEAAAFEKRFLTLSMIQNEFGIPRMAARHLLNQAGVQPYTKDGHDFGSLFLRSEAKGVFKKKISQITDNSPNFGEVSEI